MRLMQAMDDRGTVSIVLSLDLAVEPIHGSIADGSGTAREFTGWLELTSAIKALQTRAAEREES
jgi:hypothetical protein